MDFSMEMQEEQLSRGDLGLHEHPDLATSWELPKVQQFLSHEEVLLIKSHLCRFGLIINGKLSRKSTLFATTCDAIAANLQRLCNCVDGHQQLINGLPHQAQTYPPALVKAIVDVLIQDWVDQQQGRPTRLPDHGDLCQWIDELFQSNSTTGGISMDQQSLRFADLNMFQFVARDTGQYVGLVF
jgi:hypothetical protein